MMMSLDQHVFEMKWTSQTPTLVRLGEVKLPIGKI